MLVTIEYRQRTYRAKAPSNEQHYLEYMEDLLSSKRKIIHSFIMTYAGLSILGNYRGYKVEFRQLTSYVQLKIYSENSKSIDNFAYSNKFYVREFSISVLTSGNLSSVQLKAIVDSALDQLKSESNST